ncbi:MAG: ABC transporter ATP-binding protein [Ktedonobacterales bacterium]|jgi:ABC-2 type transport system ATP-binding protein
MTTTVAPTAPPATAQPLPEVILSTQGLTKRFGARVAVDDLSLDVRRGDVFALLGPNGSGKTTTLRMLLGLVWPTSGSISAFGQDFSGDSLRQVALRRIGAVVEQPTFYPYLNARENLSGIATFAGLAATPQTRARIAWALEQVGLTLRAGDAYRKYSLGMKQRLGIAAALLTDPELVILDEPTNGLDPAGISEVRALVARLSQRGVTVLLSSHLLYEVQQVCTRVAIIQMGKLIAQGAVSELLQASRGVLLSFDQPDGAQRAAQALYQARLPWAPSASYLHAEGPVAGSWQLLVSAPHERAADLNALLVGAGVTPAEVRRHEASLEQYFLSLTGGAPLTHLAPAYTTADASAPQAQAAPATTATPDASPDTTTQGGQA